MSDPICPSCSLPISGVAFETGICPCCDYRFAGATAAVEPQPIDTVVAPALPVAAPASERGWRGWPVVAGTALACGIAGGYFLFSPTGGPAVVPSPEIAAKEPALPSPSPAPPAPAPATPAPPVAPMAVAEPIPSPTVAPAPLPPGKPIVIDPLDNPDRKLDAPEGFAQVVNLNGGDRIALTGRVKVLKLGAVNGSVQFDASGLEVEEIVLAGDINGNCTLKFGARNGRVTIRGALVGSCTLEVLAPGGTVTLAEGGRIGGGATATLTAKTVEAKGIIDEGAKVSATLTAGGALRVAAMDGGAVVTYKRATPGDPAPKVETGDLRGGTRVVESK